MSFITSKKLWSRVGIVGMMLLNGCAYLDQYSINDQDESAGIDNPASTSPDMSTSQPPASDGFDTSVYHTVQPGETLYGIATRYGVNFRDIASFNGIAAPYAISPGQRLLVSAPIDNTPAQPPATTHPVDVGTPSSEPSVIVRDHRNETSAPYTPPPMNTGSENYHTVQRGEGLYSIAKRYGYTFKQVAAWNNIPPPYSLSVGQRLIVSAPQASYTPAPTYTPPPAAYTPPPVNTAADYHAVRAGDTLYSISRLYGRSVGDIARWNSLTPPYNLSVGQSLLVSDATGPTTIAAPAVAVPTVPATDVGTHTVVRGDTLYNISRRYGRSVGDIASLNNLAPPYSLSLGQVLRVSAGSSSLSRTGYRQQHVGTVRAPATTVTFHSVRSGESLASVAAMYGLTTHELAIWNGIGSPYTVYPGQRLYIVPPY